jgi:hypothetical protein
MAFHSIALCVASVKHRIHGLCVPNCSCPRLRELSLKSLLTLFIASVRQGTTPVIRWCE